MSRYTPFTWADDPSGGTPITAARLQAIEDGIDLDIPIADIDATGAADSSTFLRGDGTWAVPAGGGGGAIDLDDLTDVDVSTVAPTDGQSLVFDTADNLWKPATVSGGGGGAVNSVNTQTGDVVLNQDHIGDGSTYKQYSATEKTKLAGIATGATANSADATLLARANHTGTQSADTIVDGSTNHVFTAADDTKLGGIASGATVNDTDANLKNRANHTGTQLASTVSNFDSAARTAVRRDSTFSYGPTLIVGAGTHRIYNRSGMTRTIALVTASVGTQPTGAAVIVDVNKNGTTIFTTQSNRPQIAVSTNEDASGVPDVTSWADGDYLTIDIDQIGSTVAGAELVVTVVWS